MEFNFRKALVYLILLINTKLKSNVKEHYLIGADQMVLFVLNAAVGIIVCSTQMNCTNAIPVVTKRLSLAELSLKTRNYH